MRDLACDGSTVWLATAAGVVELRNPAQHILHTGDGAPGDCHAITVSDGQVWVGQLGDTVSTEEGQQAARNIAINLLGTLQAACDGNLNRVKRIVKVLSLVNSTPTFTEQHLVTNGCSQLLAQVFGDKGKHARSAFGVAQIPLGACVEIELIAEIE